MDTPHSVSMMRKWTAWDSVWICTGITQEAESAKTVRSVVLIKSSSLLNALADVLRHLAVDHYKIMHI